MRTRPGFVALFLAPLTLDLILKAAARCFLASRAFALPCGFRLELHVNPGVSFGLAKPWGVAAGFCGALALAALTFAVRPIRADARGALALLWAGAVSNVGERMLFGAVTDFLFVPWPGLFVNLADVWLVAGVVVWGLALLRRT